MSTELRRALEERIKVHGLVTMAESRGSTTTADVQRLRLDELDEQISRRHWLVDPAFRSALLSGREVELPWEVRAVGATARAQIGEPDFVGTLLAALTHSCPLFRVSSVFQTEHGGDLPVSWVKTPGAGNDIIADGAAISPSADPVFDRAVLKAFKYAQLAVASMELVTDSVFDLEDWAAAQVVDELQLTANVDLWGGGGTTEPTGLLAGLTTHTAASATTVVVDDVLDLLEAVPSKYWPRTSILMAAGAWADLTIQTLGTSAAGGMAMSVNMPGRDRWLAGFPVFIDPGLAAPATTTKPVVAGAFDGAFGIRLAPIRVKSDVEGSIDKDTMRIRVVLRLDGAPMVTDACRALVMA